MIKFVNNIKHVVVKKKSIKRYIYVKNKVNINR